VVCVGPVARVATPLWFIYPAERASDPVIAALLDVLREIWGVRETGASPVRQAVRLSRGGRASRSPA
jgi:hypothetical protein